MECSKTYLSMTRADRAEFDALVRRCHRQAYNVAYRLAGNPADAEDLTQEAFVRAYRFFDRYNRDMPFENWLYRIINNVFIDELRRRPKNRPQSLDQTFANANGDSELQIELPDNSHNPESLMLEAQLDEPIQRALNTLTPDFRQAVVLADVEGLSYEEIADIMKCSLGTVRSRLHRGRKMLRRKLETCSGWDVRRG